MPYKLTGKTQTKNMSGWHMRKLVSQLHDIAKAKGINQGTVDADTLQFMLAPIEQELGQDPWKLFKENVWKLQGEGVIIMDRKEIIALRNDIVNKLREQIKQTEHDMRGLVNEQLGPLAEGWGTGYAADVAARAFARVIVNDIIRDAKADEPMCTECGHSLKHHADRGQGACRRCGHCHTFQN